jgi:hypothetical protein
MSMPAQTKLSFSSADAYWLMLALETIQGQLGNELVELQRSPADDEAWCAYDRLHKRCKEFWMRSATAAG